METIKYYFTYGELDGRDMGIKIRTTPTVFPPIRKRNDTDTFSVDGKDFQFSNAYTERKISVPFRMVGTYNLENVSKISRIFSIPQAKLTFSWDPDVYYIATVDNGEIDEVFKDHGEGIIDFICNPYKFRTSGETFRPLAQNITNEYQETKPVIRFKGSGNVNITVGGKTLYFKGLPTSNLQWIQVDSNINQVYLESGEIYSHFLDLASDFPVLVPGSNLYSSTGTITAIEIKPNWREI